jgi:hypothetical protein
VAVVSESQSIRHQVHDHLSFSNLRMSTKILNSGGSWEGEGGGPRKPRDFIGIPRSSKLVRAAPVQRRRFAKSEGFWFEFPLSGARCAAGTFLSFSLAGWLLAGRRGDRSVIQSDPDPARHREPQPRRCRCRRGLARLVESCQVGAVSGPGRLGQKIQPSESCEILRTCTCSPPSWATNRYTS